MARSSGVRRLALAGSLAVAGLTVSGCSLADLPRFGFPEGITPQGQRMQIFWSGAFIASLIIGVLVWGLMFWAFAVYRKKKNSPLYPKQTKENGLLEITYTVIPVFLVAILFYFTVTTENYVLAKQENPDVTVNVTAFKWNWDFGYEGTKNAEGTLVHTIGSSEEVPILVLPVDRVIQYNLESKDVLHAFWVPDFIFKRDVFPNPKENNTDNVFQNTIERTGWSVGRCAELCGTYHSAMNFEVRAVPGEVYDAYIAARQTTNPATGQSYTAAEALAKVGADMPQLCDAQLCSPKANSTRPFNTDREAGSAPVEAGN